MKKVISIILALSLILTAAIGLTGCGEEEASGKMTVYGGINSSSALANIDEVHDEFHAVWEGYNPDVEIEWIEGDIQMIMASGDYPDVIMKTVFQNQDVAKYAAQGILLPMEDYITEENTPNIWRMFQEQPTTKAIATSPDGHIYSLPSYSGNKSSFLETYYIINKVWLDKLGLEVPKTLDELYEVLKAFKTQDPNGNGKADEIPFMFGNEMAYSYPETLLSAWGVSTKFGMYDGWLNVVDGNVRFTPLLDEWREMCKFYNKLWDEGLLDIESFTQESSQFNAKINSTTPIVGVTINYRLDVMEPNQDEYIVVEPFSADGKITPVLHIHPGSIGTRNSAHITSNCEDPAAALKFIDGFYDKKQTVMNWYGGVGEDKTFHMEGDMFAWNEPEEGEAETDLYAKNTVWGPYMLGYIDSSVDYNTLIEVAPFMSKSDDNFKVVEKFVDKETWSRPFYTTEDSSRVNELLTDITTYVEQMKANFITGKTDVNNDAEWDKYIAQLKKLGAEEYREINQRAYDIHQGVLDELAGK